MIITSGKPISSKEMKVTARVAKQLGDESMGSLWEAIVEFITNVDDSYERLANSKKEKSWLGKCLIEYFPGGKKNFTTLIVKDQAEGMSYETLNKCFGHYGEKQSGSASRGHAGRGAKDASSIGDVTVVSIKDGLFSQIKLDPHKVFHSYFVNQKAKKKDYDLIGLKQGKNGTAIMLEISPEKSGYHLRASDLLKKIPNHYALNQILDKKNKTLNLKFVSGKEIDETLTHQEPEGDLVEEKVFYVNDYKDKYGEDSKVIFKLFKSKVPLDSGDGDKRFRQWGISVIGKKAVHEKSLLDINCDLSPEGKYYFGYLKTNLISRLLADYDENQKKKNSPLADNPTSIIDLKRVDGINRSHPASINIFRIPIDIIKKNLLIDRNSSENKNIENENTKDALSQVAKECAKLMDDLFEEDNSDIEGIDIDPNQWKFIPPSQNINVGEKKNIYANTKKESLNSNLNTAFIKIAKNDQNCLNLIQDKAIFKESKRKKNVVYFKFEIEALTAKKNVLINVYQKEGQVKTSLNLNILSEKPRIFQHDIEFENEIYNIKNGKSRRIKIFAKVPEVLNDKMSNQSMEAKVFNSKPEHVKVLGKCEFTLSNSNYAIGLLNVAGARLSANNEIMIQLGDRRASTFINVLNKEQDENENKSKFQFNIVKLKFGNQRYMWSPQNPNTLEIAGEHDQLKRYLGKKEDGYPGQETSCFKALLAEIITEAMMQKRMTANSRYDPSVYSVLIDIKNIEDTIMNFIVKSNEEKFIFLSNIHKILLKDSVLNEEIRKFTKSLN